MSRLRSCGLNHTFMADLESLWKVSQLHAPKLAQVFKLFFLLSSNWNYVWNTLFGVSQVGRHLRAQSSSRDETLSVQLSLIHSPLDYQSRSLEKKKKKCDGFQDQENSWVLGSVAIHCLTLKKIQTGPWEQTLCTAHHCKSQYGGTLCSEIAPEWHNQSNRLLGQEHCYILLYIFS